MRKLLSALLFIGITASAQTVTLHHFYYTNIYDTIKKAPVYTFYTLTKDHLKKVLKRGSAFYTDPLIENRQQASNAIYKNNGIYDKGHLSPAADFTFDSTAYRECMYYTNTAPQFSYFNRHLWLAIENAVRDTCNKYNIVKVYTGCFYENQQMNKIAIPACYWKVIIYDNGRKTAWMAANTMPASNSPDAVLFDAIAIERDAQIQLK